MIWINTVNTEKQKKKLSTQEGKTATCLGLGHTRHHSAQPLRSFHRFIVSSFHRPPAARLRLNDGESNIPIDDSLCRLPPPPPPPRCESTDIDIDALIGPSTSDERRFAADAAAADADDDGDKNV
jgi:hypothetical protein